MTGLLDHIFSRIEDKDLDRAQIIAYVQYLDEIIFDGLPLEKEQEYQAIKFKLTSRINALNQEQIKFYNKEKEDKEEK